MPRERVEPNVVFGELKVIRPALKREFPQHPAGYWWRCECLACGNRFFRRRQYLQKGGWQMCLRCSRQQRSGLFQRKRQSTFDVIRDVYLNTGSLYSDESDARSMDWIKRKCEEIGCFDSINIPDDNARKRILEHLDVMPSSDGYHNLHQQRMAYAIPLNGDDQRMWQCSTCMRHFRDGFGCSICSDVFCLECARKERHKHEYPTGGIGQGVWSDTGVWSDEGRLRLLKLLPTFLSLSSVRVSTAC